MRRVVFTGGPGAGKTAVLNELRSRGHATVGDSARSIIADRLRKNQSPRPEPPEFAHTVLRRDVESYACHTPSADLVFYDRGVVDALCMLDEAHALDHGNLEALLTEYAYHRDVFVFPPWREIYTDDAERDQSFIEAEQVHSRVISWYRKCKYELIEVPKGDVEGRSKYVLQMLGPVDA